MIVLTEGSTLPDPKRNTSFSHKQVTRPPSFSHNQVTRPPSFSHKRVTRPIFKMDYVQTLHVAVPIIFGAIGMSWAHLHVLQYKHERHEASKREDWHSVLMLAVEINYMRAAFSGFVALGSLCFLWGKGPLQLQVGWLFLVNVTSIIVSLTYAYSINRETTRLELLEDDTADMRNSFSVLYYVNSIGHFSRTLFLFFFWAEILIYTYRSLPKSSS